jgi:hypothetical protein
MADPSAPLPYHPLLAAAVVPVRPAGQAAAPATTPTAPSCPACGHCASLPSSESAYAAISKGRPGDWLLVGRDLVLRGALIWVGIAAYDKATGREDPHRLARAVAGAAGIEVFVLLWTVLKSPPRT